MRQAWSEWGRRHTVLLLAAVGLAALGLLYLVTNQDSDRQVIGALAQYEEEPPEEPGGPPGPPDDPGPPDEPPGPPDEPPGPPDEPGPPQETPGQGPPQGTPGGGPPGTAAGATGAGSDCSLRQDPEVRSERFQAPDSRAVRRASGPTDLPDTHDVDCLALVLTGDRVVPGPGDPNGLGRMEMTLGSICYTINWMEIGKPTSITIREGGEGEKGPIAQKLIPNPDKSKPERRRQVKRVSAPLDDCVFEEFDEELTEALRSDLLLGSQRFYVEVATKKFPKGAIRGQITQLDRAPRLENLSSLLRTSDKGSFLKTDGKRSR